MRQNPRAKRIGPREDVIGCLSQKQGSFQKDEEIWGLLVEQAPNQWERRRLRRLKCDHAGAWLAAVPSTHDGMDTVMRPRNFQVAVSVRLGVPVLSEERRCSSCTQTKCFWRPCRLLREDCGPHSSTQPR